MDIEYEVRHYAMDGVTVGRSGRLLSTKTYKDPEGAVNGMALAIRLHVGTAEAEDFRKRFGSDPSLPMVRKYDTDTLLGTHWFVLRGRRAVNQKETK